MQLFYKSNAASTLEIVTNYEKAKHDFLTCVTNFGHALGGKVAVMRNIDSYFAGGFKKEGETLSSIHWCKADDHGYSRLRTKATPPKGSTKDERQAFADEHKRLVETWNAHCPQRVAISPYWDLLNVNSEQILLCGGVMFSHQGTAYFTFGFALDEKRYREETAANGKSSSSWIEGAIEILPSEYETACKAYNGNK